MSLRYKALIAVVLLVAVLAGALAFTSGERFESDARERIRGELRKDALYLNNQVSAAARGTRNALEISAESSELVQLFSSSIEIADNLATFAWEWRDASDGDLAIATLDAFIASQRKATQLGNVGKELAIVAANARDSDVPTNALLADPELLEFIDSFYQAHLEGADGAGTRSQAAVLPVGGSVYLVVQSLLYESIQQQLVAGVGIVLTEISRGWIERNLPRLDEEANPVQKLVFAGDQISASTLEDAETSRFILEQALALDSRGAGEQFEAALDSRTWLGLAVTSSFAPEHLVNRPGFIAVKDLDAELDSFVAVRTGLFAFAAGLAVLAAMVAYFGAWLVIRRLRRLQDATVRVREGQFDTKVNVRGRDEVAKLGKAFNDMTSGLKALGLYTHETLARSVLDNPELLGESSAREEGSIFFSDIKGFTPIAEGMGAEAVTAQLNEYFAKLGEALRSQNGYVDKFIGDSIMAFWGPPFIKEGNYAERACAAAMQCLQACAALREDWQKRGKPLFYQRIGIATGDVVVGTIGTETKKNFTVIGDAVNLASRLEGANKLYGTEILVDERTAELAAGSIQFREIDQIRVVGKSKPVRIFEPLPQAEPTGHYSQALAAYRRREFEAALAILANAPQDGPAAWLSAECRRLASSAPPPDWEPVTTATSK